MVLDTFRARLRDAAESARAFAERFVIEKLPSCVSYHVRLNASYDATTQHADMRTFPEDSRIDRSELATRTEDQVATLLWRDGAIPQWINVTVNGVTESTTVIDLTVCGRFTRREDLLYHAREGRPPFHVLGPPLPPHWREGERFSVHRTADCWSAEELAAVIASRQHVWSLTLGGAALDDEDVGSLPAFEALELLELDEVRLDGSSLATLDRHARLRVLRLRLTRRRPFSALSTATLPQLERLDVHGLASKPWGFEALAARLPRLHALTLDANDRLHAAGAAPPALQEISIRARDVTSSPTLPSRMRAVILHIPKASRGAVDAILNGVEHVDAIHLRGTPTTEEQARDLLARLQPSFLDLVDTGVGKEAVRRIAAQNPELKIFPNLTRPSSSPV